MFGTREEYLAPRTTTLCGWIHLLLPRIQKGTLQCIRHRDLKSNTRENDSLHVLSFPIILIASGQQPDTNVVFQRSPLYFDRHRVRLLCRDDICAECHDKIRESPCRGENDMKPFDRHGAGVETTATAPTTKRASQGPRTRLCDPQRAPRFGGPVGPVVYLRTLIVL